MPGHDAKTSESISFSVVAALMALGMVFTSIIGVILAFRFSRRPLVVAMCLAAGLVIPVAFLLMAAN